MNPHVRRREVNTVQRSVEDPRSKLEKSSMNIPRTRAQQVIVVCQVITLEDEELTSFTKNSNRTLKMLVSIDSLLNFLSCEREVVQETTDKATKPAFAFMVDGWGMRFDRY